jgi:hypothetical protein
MSILTALCTASGLLGAEAAPPRPAAKRVVGKRAASPGNTTYYVDGQAGRDGNAGTSPERAWKSIDRVNHTSFAPGDSILFAGGQTFKGTLHFTSAESGVPGRPIRVSSFGQGRAIVDAGTGDGFLLTDCAYIHINNLNFVGCGRKNGSDGTGLRLLRTHNVELSGIDVSGFRLAGVATGGDENTRLTHIRAHNNGFAGISVYGGHGDVPRTRNLYIGDCIAENNPGDPKNLTNHSGNGIVVGGTDGALIEYCAASNNGWDMPRKGNGPVGIWGWNCDRLIIRCCISYDNKSPGEDGDGFDFDGGVTNSILEYNLSYDNVGCGYLLCQYPGAPLWKNNIVRYNISINDGAKNFQSGIGLWLGDAGISDALIYNNVIVNSQHGVSTLGDLPGMIYRNNVFLVGGDVLVGSLAKSRFENNLYWNAGKGALYRDGNTVYMTLEAWTKATSQETMDGRLVGLCADPKLVLPADMHALPTDPRQLAAMPLYRPLPGSPCLGTGMTIPDNGGRDFFNHHLAPDAKPSLGVCEAAGVKAQNSLDKLHNE